MPGCTSVGETEEAALANIDEAIRDYFEPVDLGADQGFGVSII